MDLRQYEDMDEAQHEALAHKQLRVQIRQEFEAFKETRLYKGFLDAVGNDLEPLMALLLAGGSADKMNEVRVKAQGLLFARGYFEDIEASIQENPNAFEEVEGDAVLADEMTARY